MILLSFFSDLDILQKFRYKLQIKTESKIIRNHRSNSRIVIMALYQTSNGFFKGNEIPKSMKKSIKDDFPA